MPTFGTFQKHCHTLGLAKSVLENHWHMAIAQAKGLSWFSATLSEGWQKSHWDAPEAHRGWTPRAGKSHCECRNAMDEHQPQFLLEKGKYWVRKPNTTVFCQYSPCQDGMRKSKA